MPGTVLDLKDKLTGAIDSEGNVLNMAVVLEVIGVLEQTSVTAEELHVSRLGKYVNWIRKQTKDKTLGRRIKQLLKAWQKLANSATVQNGLQSKARDTLTSAVRPVSPVSQPSSSTLLHVSASVSSAPVALAPLSTVATPSSPTTSASSFGTQTIAASKSDPVFNRLKKRSLFSAVKKSESPQPSTLSPPTITTTTTTTSSSLHFSSAPLFTTAGFSQPIIALQRTSPLPLLLIEDITPVEPTDSNKIQLSSDTEATVARNGLESHSTMIANTRPLLVQSPVSLQKDSEREEEKDNVGESSLIVSIPRHLVQLPPIATSVSQSRNQSLLVSINRQFFTSLPSNNRVHPMSSKEEAQSLPNLSRPSAPCVSGLEAPSGRLKQTIFGVPGGCSDGIDGCVGQDGIWYEWTEYIPGTQEAVVTILPYVYVDGWDDLS